MKPINPILIFLSHVALLFFLIPFLPFFLPFWFFTDPRWKKSGTKNLFTFGLSMFFILWLIIIPYSFVYGTTVYTVASALGYIPQTIQVSGTGSMYPTFPKGHGSNQKQLAREVVSVPPMYPYPGGIMFKSRRIFGKTLSRGDIVVAQNDTIERIGEKLYGEKSGIVKRIIAIPGDTIELRDGIVSINSIPQKEPYTAKPRSTFGGAFLPDCKKITVPPEKYFLMGDNRKASSDSRHEIGFVNERDITYVIPFAKQKGLYDKNWRNTEHDFAQTSKLSINPAKVLERINQYRKEAGVTPLTNEPKLNESAKKRGEVILRTDDFSFNATRSGYTIQKSFSDVGYSNITWGEWVHQGYYDTDELIESMFEFSQTKKFALDGDFDDFGIAQVDGTINNCPTRVIVEHYAGYIPPNYSQKDIDGWKKVLDNLTQISPGWNALKNSGGFYDRNRDDVDRINDIISQRISHIQTIIARMEKNQWLTPQEQSYISQDQTLFSQQEELAKKLNAQ